MEKEFDVVGVRLPMMDAAQKVKGSALFTDDLVLPGMLYGKILRSPLPHAKISNKEFRMMKFISFEIQHSIFDILRFSVF